MARSATTWSQGRPVQTAAGQATGAADFYGKLEGLLQGQTDRPRVVDGASYFELGELTSKIGDKK